jgi:hypothetical protein
MSFDLDQVLVGEGRGDNGAYDRAVEIASQLHAVDKWDGQGRIVIHNPYSVHRWISLTPGRFDQEAGVTVHEGIRDLVKGESYEIRPLSSKMARALSIPEENVLEG